MFLLILIFPIAASAAASWSIQCDSVVQNFLWIDAQQIIGGMGSLKGGWHGRDSDRKGVEAPSNFQSSLDEEDVNFSNLNSASIGTDQVFMILNFNLRNATHQSFPGTAIFPDGRRYEMLCN